MGQLDNLSPEELQALQQQQQLPPPAASSNMQMGQLGSLAPTPQYRAPGMVAQGNAPLQQGSLPQTSVSMSGARGGDGGGYGSQGVSMPSMQSSGGGGLGGILMALLTHGRSLGNQPDPMSQAIKQQEFMLNNQTLMNNAKMAPYKEKEAELALQQKQIEIQNSLIDQSTKQADSKLAAQKLYVQKSTMGGLAAAQIMALPQPKREEYYQMHKEFFQHIDENAPDHWDEKYMRGLISTAALTGEKLQIDPDLMALTMPEEDRAQVKEIFKSYQQKNDLKMQTDVGKTISDMAQLKERGYKEDSPEMKALQKNLDTSGLSNKEAAQQEDTLRTSYLQQSQGYKQQSEAYSRLDSLRTPDYDKNPSADTALLYSYMKLINPASMVREGSIASVEDAAGIPDKIRDLYNNAVNGDRLKPEQREKLLKAADELYKSAQTQHNALTKEYERIAKNKGLDESNVIINLDYNKPKPTPQATQLPKGITEDMINAKAKELGRTPEEVRQAILQQEQQKQQEQQ